MDVCIVRHGNTFHWKNKLELKLAIAPLLLWEPLANQCLLTCSGGGYAVRREANAAISLGC